MPNPDASVPKAARNLPDKFLVAFSFAEEQRALVRAIAEAVERKISRAEVFLDEWFTHVIGGFDGHRKLREIYAEKCHLAVVCLSGDYGRGTWTGNEYAALSARLFNSYATQDARERDAIFPIRVGEGEFSEIPSTAIIPDARALGIETMAQLIVDRLRTLVPALDPGVDSTTCEPVWPQMRTPLVWTLADHERAREAFVELLSCEARWRFLPIRGASDTGKSHMTREMLGNALNIRDFACGRFDFKGTTAMDEELNSFVVGLRVPPPPPDRPLNEGLRDILGALDLRARPACLIFDTYELAGEGRNWVENILLPGLIRATWLRVVIAGQSVPERAGTAWARVACPPLELGTPRPVDWFELGRQRFADLTLPEVELICRRASNRAGLLAQFFGEVT